MLDIYKEATFDFTETKKVFDTSLYLHIPKERRAHVIANDLSGLVLEAGDRQLDERINPWYVAITPDGNIVNLASREEVSKNFGSNNELARNERQGAIDFYYNNAVNAKEGDLIFWFSPSGGNSPYKEARVSVAKVRSLLGLKILECYGIPTKLTPNKILSLANYVNAMSESQRLFNPDDLRKTSILWPSVVGDDSPWEIFTDNLKLDSNAWEAIANGSPRKIKREAYKAALPEARRMSRDLEFANSEQDFIIIGARSEIFMAANGWKIDEYQCEGKLNSALLGKSITVDALGNFRLSSSKENWDWHTGDCVVPAPECGRTNVEVGPCSICRECQKKFDQGLN